MRLFFMAVCMSLIVWPATAQFEQDYTPIKFTGTIPIEFLENARNKSEEEIQNRKADNLSRKQGKEFYVVQNYMLNEIFLSGMVYFNDELTTYLNEVAHELLKNQPDIRQNVRFYVTKSQVPNAFAWRDGKLFFNIGLLDFIESEAQLAYIMSHEIQHYLSEHALQRFKYSKDIEKGLFSKKSELDNFLSQMKYSRDKELEADEGGLDVYLESSYAPIEAVKALEMLDRVDKDKYSKPLDLIAVFSTESFKVDSSWLCDPELFADEADDDGKAAAANDRGKARNSDRHKYETADDEAGEEEEDDHDENEDDKYSTHPSIARRVEELRTRLSILPDTLGPENLVSETKFTKMKEIVSFEIIQEYYADADYFRSLYEALNLQNKYPDNAYLAEMIAHNLYWISYYFDIRSINSLMEDYDKYAGQPYGEFLCFFDYLDDDDMIDMAYAHIEMLMSRFPDNPEIEIAFARLSPLNKKAREGRKIYKEFSKKHPENRHAEFADEMGAKNRQ